MARTESNMIQLGSKAFDFHLPEPLSGKIIHLEDYKNYEAYVILFICNHCPYVIHVHDELLNIGREYQSKNCAFFAISSNDVANYPDDAPENMKERAIQFNYPFPYLYDESQEVAKAYDAACTPDIYVYDKNKLLVYRGRMDASRPNSGIPVTGIDLRNALDAVLTNQAIDPIQYPSLGCNIKWKE